MKWAPKSKSKTISSGILKIDVQFEVSLQITLHLLYATIDPDLQGEEHEERDHQAEQAHGLGKGEAENGIREELLLERWVARVGHDERTEHCSDSSARTGGSGGGGTSTCKLIVNKATC